MVQPTQYNRSVPKHQRQLSTVGGLSKQVQSAANGNIQQIHYSSVFKRALIEPAVLLWTGARVAGYMIVVVNVNLVMPPHSLKSSGHAILSQVREVSKFYLTESCSCTVFMSCLNMDHFLLYALTLNILDRHCESKRCPCQSPNIYRFTSPAKIAATLKKAIIFKVLWEKMTTILL